MRPMRSWPLRTWIMLAGAFPLLLHQRAGGVGRLEGFRGRDRLDDLVVVPRVFRLLGRLDLGGVHVLTIPAVAGPRLWTSDGKPSRPARFCFLVMPNSFACLMELIVSAPALARPTICAPELWAWSR